VCGSGGEMNERNKIKYQEKQMPQTQSIHHKSHRDFCETQRAIPILEVDILTQILTMPATTIPSEIITSLITYQTPQSLGFQELEKYLSN
jgi:hypothetical protein